MIRSLIQWIAGDNASRRTHRTAGRRRHASPVLESLEGRQLMTVTGHGGAVLPNVEVQALYYGSDWDVFNNPIYAQQVGYLEAAV
jgi:hypothetical protein